MVSASVSPDLAARPPWQGAVWEQLVRLETAGRLPHALLIEGLPGTGRGRFATSLARRLLCEDPRPEGPCEQCKGCELSASGAHSDLQVLTPEEEGKAIGIDAVRRAIQFVNGTASLGQRKTLLVNPAESLTIAAFNAFLKCLEEPSANTHIILVAPSGYPLPATIRSRCQRWSLPAPDVDAATDWLMAEGAGEGFAPDPATIADVLELTGMQPLRALDLLRSEHLDVLRALRRQVKDGSSAGAPSLEAVAAQLEPDELLDALESLLRSRLRQCSANELRDERGVAAFSALDTLSELRGARRAGTNPNPELLRFTALQACAGLWEHR